MNALYTLLLDLQFAQALSFGHTDGCQDKSNTNISDIPDYNVETGSQAYFGKSAPKIQHLRADSLAMLLSLANIGANAKVRTALAYFVASQCSISL